MQIFQTIPSTSNVVCFRHFFADRNHVFFIDSLAHFGHLAGHLCRRRNGWPKRKSPARLPRVSRGACHHHLWHYLPLQKILWRRGEASKGDACEFQWLWKFPIIGGLTSFQKRWWTTKYGSVAMSPGRQVTSSPSLASGFATGLWWCGWSGEKLLKILTNGIPQTVWRAQSRTHTHNHTYIYIHIGIHQKSLISKGGYPQKVIACYWTEKPQANNPRWVVLAEVFSDSLDSEVKIHMTWANRLEHGCFVGGVEDGYSISYDELYNVFASSILIYLDMCYLFRNKVPKLATMCWCPSPILELRFIPWVGWSSGCIWILDIGGYQLTTILQIHSCYNRIYNVPIPKMLNIKGPLYWGFSWATNVSSWLVARFAIVANFLQIILKLMYCLEGSLLWQKKHWESLLFGKKQPVIAEKQTFFLKNAEAQSSFCSALYLSL